MSKQPMTFSTPSLVFRKRLHAGLSVGVPLALTVAAVVMIPIPAPSVWIPLAVISVGMYAVGQLGISLGFHRLFAHQSFTPSRALKLALGVMGSMAAQGPIINWVSDHRRHHAFSDQVGDPHSPHVGDASNGGMALHPFRGFWHAQCGWLFGAHMTNMARYAPDLIRDPLVLQLSNRYFVWVLLGFGLPTAMGWLWIGGLNGAFLGLLWGGFVRLFVAYHLTWATNSLNHLIGRRPFDTGDYSTNIWILGAIDFGEGWHNNHHAFPNSAKFGLSWWQLDPAWLTLKGLMVLGAASHAVVPSDDQILRKKRGAK